MDFEDTPKEAEFRAKCRAWLEKNASALGPHDAAGGMLGEGEAETGDVIAASKSWQAKKFDAGWAVLTWPKEYGGQGLGRMEQIIWSQEEAKFQTPVSVFMIGHGMLGPTLMAHGTEEQKKRFLPEMARGDEIWCQLFSEPAAGSDLAGLRTTAVRDGDEWVINGQKIWSTGAHYSGYGMIVTRTDPDAPKHKGLTYFVIDMKSPGVEARPIKQINGGAAFNEVFFTDVRVPDANRLGAVGNGWNVALTTLMNERVAIGAGGGAGGFRRLIELARKSRRGGRPAIEDQAVRQRLADFYIISKGLQFTSPRPRSRAAHRRVPGIDREGDWRALLAADGVVRDGASGARRRGARPLDRSRRRALAGALSRLARHPHCGRHRRGAPQHHRGARPRPPAGDPRRQGQALPRHPDRPAEQIGDRLAAEPAVASAVELGSVRAGPLLVTSRLTEARPSARPPDRGSRSSRAACGSPDRWAWATSSGGKACRRRRDRCGRRAASRRRRRPDLSVRAIERRLGGPRAIDLGGTDRPRTAVFR